MNFFYYDKPVKTGHFIYPLDPFQVSHSPLTKVGFDKSGGRGGRGSLWGLQGGRAPLHRKILHFWAQFAWFGAYFFTHIKRKSLHLFIFFYVEYETDHFIYPLVPLQVPHSLLTKAGVDESMRGEEPPYVHVGKFCMIWWIFFISTLIKSPDSFFFYVDCWAYETGQFIQGGQTR